MSGIYTDIRYNTMVKAFENKGVAIPDTSSPIEIDPDALLTFIAWGDPQISSIEPPRAARTAAGCRDLESMKGKADALVLLGDITEYGRECEYKQAADLFNSVSHKFSHFFAVTGNHDIRLRAYKPQIAKFNSFIRSVKGGVAFPEDRAYFSYKINGFKFIMMGTETATFEGSYISDRQLAWLDRELAAEDSGGKPVFVFNHQALKLTHGLPHTWQGLDNWRGSVGWQSEKIRAVFEKHNNVVYITGHLHFGASQMNYEDSGCFKALSVPTIGASNHGEVSNESQGYIISAYSDRLEIRARFHADGVFAPEDKPGAKIIVKYDTFR